MSISDIEENAASTYGVPETLALDLFGAESANNPNAVNPSTGAMGLGQILPSTAANPGYGISPLTNPFDPTANANFAMQYLAALFKQFGSWVAAVLHYYPNAATDPNYASTYAAAQAADNANMSDGTFSFLNGALANNPSLGTAYADTGQFAAGPGTAAPTTAAAAAASLPSLGFIGNYLARGGLIILGVGLILVAVMALARRSDVATETARLAHVGK